METGIGLLTAQLEPIAGECWEFTRDPYSKVSVGRITAQDGGPWT